MPATANGLPTLMLGLVTAAQRLHPLLFEHHNQNVPQIIKRTVIIFLVRQAFFLWDLMRDVLRVQARIPATGCGMKVTPAFPP